MTTTAAPPRRPRTARGRTAAGLVAFALVTLALTAGAVALAPPGSDVAAWWPAAGFGVAVAMRTTGRTRLAVVALVCAVSALGNALGGRPPALSVAFAVANAAEVALSAWVLTRGGRAPVLDDLDDLWRLGVAVAAGAGVIGLIAGGAVALLADGQMASAALGVMASHAAAQILLVPVAMTRGRPAVRWREVLVIAALLAAVTWWVFGEGQRLPLSSLPLPLLVWAAARAGTGVLTRMLLGFGVTVTMLSGRSGGPFVLAEATGSPLLTTRLLQVYLLIAFAVTVPLALVVRQRALATARLAESEQLFRDGFGGAILGMLVLRRDAEGLRIVRANAAAAAKVGLSWPGCEGELWSTNLREEDRLAVDAAVTRMRTGELEGWRGEVAVLTPTLRWLEVAVAPLPGQPDLFTAQLVDVTARRVAAAQIAFLAMHDPLTGLANRQVVHERLQAALDGTADDRGATLLWCDLDGFKSVNDTAGHHVGDEVLRVVARRLERIARPDDTVARIGGDEFVVLCPGVVGRATAVDLAERIRQAVGAPIQVEGGTHRVGVSVGVAIGHPGDAVDGLLRAADAAMYRVKATGRDGVQVAGPAGTVLHLPD